MTANTPGREYFPALDGLRGLAILLVVISHNFSFIPYAQFIGITGVDLFFVLSGFLITDILLRSRDQNSYFLPFYKRRIYRIFPLYYIIIILFFLIPPANQNLQPGYQYYSDNWPFVWFHLNNILPAVHERPDVPLLLNHLWSLSLEEQFYLFWPLLIRYVRSVQHLVLVAIFIVTVCIFSRFFLWKELYTHPLLFWHIVTNIRIDFFIAGSLLSVLHFFYPLRYKSMYGKLCLVTLTLYTLFYFISRVHNPLIPHFTIAGYTIMACFLGLLTLFCLQPVATKSFFSSPFLGFFGKISYSLYLIHWPVLLIGNQHFFSGNQKISILQAAATGLLMAAFSVVLSILSYKYLETRFFVRSVEAQKKLPVT